MKDNEPLFKGGCGHSDKSIERSADLWGAVLIVSLIFFIIFLIAPLIIG